VAKIYGREVFSTSACVHSLLENNCHNLDPHFIVEGLFKRVKPGMVRSYVHEVYITDHVYELRINLLQDLDVEIIYGESEFTNPPMPFETEDLLIYVQPIGEMGFPWTLVPEPGLFVMHVVLPNGKTVLWDGYKTVEIISLPDDDMCGICGNYDMNSDNDWSMGRHTDASEHDSPDCPNMEADGNPGDQAGSATELVSSWLTQVVPGACKAECKPAS
jgi:hypothetical protein